VNGRASIERSGEIFELPDTVNKISIRKINEMNKDKRMF
jgi:hypothetical protein